MKKKESKNERREKPRNKVERRQGEEDGREGTRGYDLGAIFLLDGLIFHLH